MPARVPPPYQLVRGDQFNLALGCSIAFILAACKDLNLEKIPLYLRFQLRTYTIWNLSFCGVRLLLGQEQWDPFLLLNSIGICNGFRTGFCQGLDENMRKKLEAQMQLAGLEFPRWQFVLTDHAVHSLPPLVLLAAIVRRQQRVHPMNSLFAAVISTWFAFRQGAQLDSSDIYVPHPWRRAWLAIFASMAFSPGLVDALIARDRKKAVLLLGLLLVPYLSARLDPNLRKKYNFEAALARSKQKEQEDRSPALGPSIPRCATTPPPGLAQLQ